MKFPNSDLEWFTVGFAFDTDYKKVALIEKQKAWCKGKWNGIGGSIEESDESPLDAQRREFWEEAGIHLANWEFFCQLHEPRAVVEFFRTAIPLSLLRSVRTKTIEVVRVFDVECVQRQPDLYPLMPNLSWLLPMAQSSCGIIANVIETSPLVGLCTAQA
jgi:8-oxo-dGTP pyrophosphatase MutT (NUDIX family)